MQDDDGSSKGKVHNNDISTSFATVIPLYSAIINSVLLTLLHYLIIDQKPTLVVGGAVLSGLRCH